jgi:hypothetical protein
LQSFYITCTSTGHGKRARGEGMWLEMKAWLNENEDFMSFEISYSEVTLDKPKRHYSFQTDFRQTEKTCERMCRFNVFRDHHHQRNNKEGNKRRLKIDQFRLTTNVRSDLICLPTNVTTSVQSMSSPPSHSVVLVYLTIS